MATLYLGVEVKGARRWLTLGPIGSIQPSEFAKIGALVFLFNVGMTMLKAKNWTAIQGTLLGGLVFLSHQLGSFLGVWMGGYLYDRFGTYDEVWWLGVALGLFAAVVHWPIREQAIARPVPTPA